MVAMNTYTVNVERDGKFWYIRVPQIGHSTQARTVAEIEPMARDLIAVMERVPADSFEVQVHISLPELIEAQLEARAKAHQEVAKATAAEAEAVRLAAKELAATMPLRDAAAILGLSHQRVHQLVNS